MAKKRGRQRFIKDKETEEAGGILSQWELSPEARRGILVVFLFVLVALSVLSLLNLAGAFGAYIERGLSLLFGWSRWFFPLAVFILGYMTLRPRRYTLTMGTYLGLILIIAGLDGLLHMFFDLGEGLDIIELGQGGGYIGFLASFPLRSAMGATAAIIILVALVIIGLLVMLNTSLTSLVEARQLGWWRSIKLYWQERKYRGQPSADKDGATAEEEAAELESPAEEEVAAGEESAEAEEGGTEEEMEKESIKPKKRLPKIDLP